MKRDRREYLRDYLLACLNENVFSWAELLSVSGVDKVLRAMSADVRAVVKDVLRTGASNGLDLVKNWLLAK